VVVRPQLVQHVRDERTFARLDLADHAATRHQLDGRRPSRIAGSRRYPAVDIRAIGTSAARTGGGDASTVRA
jgi:hypothetical protein